MDGGSKGVAAFVFLSDTLSEIPQVLKKAFSHAWIASYQIGFGPPLVRYSGQLVKRVREAKSALEKLDAYFEMCILDEEVCAELLKLHKTRLVRKMGPIEAEMLDQSSTQIIDLSLRLHIPCIAPPRAMGQMDRAGVDLNGLPQDTSPEELSGRFYVHLHDPRQARLLHIEQVAELVRDPDCAAALELRVPVGMRWFWSLWAQQFTEDTGYKSVDLGEPASHARVLRDGYRA